MKTLEQIINELREKGTPEIDMGVTIQQKANNILNKLKREQEEINRINKYGIIKMNYSEYKTSEYRCCKTQNYDKKTKMIEVITRPVITSEKCPKCGTYCYGDCKAN